MTFHITKNQINIKFFLNITTHYLIKNQINLVNYLYNLT